MKNKMYPKLLLLAIVSAMFIFSFGQNAEVSKNQAAKINNDQVKPYIEASASSGSAGKGAVKIGITDHRSNQDAKTPGGQVEPDYWAWLKSQFVWNWAGKRPAPSTGTAGC